MDFLGFTLVSFIIYGISVFFPEMPIAEAVCDPQSGPSGTLDCSEVYTRYEARQWAVCLSADYMYSISGGRYQCIKSYCNLPCMQEAYNISLGSVYPKCSCAEGQSLSLSKEIPGWCYSPEGGDCTFYEACLEKMYPCEDRGILYALDFEKQFCALHENHISSFSQGGQEWIEFVKRCFQVELAPLLRPYENPSCEDIRKKTLQSHTRCYHATGYVLQELKTICDLSINDWLRVFVTVRIPLAWKMYSENALEDNIDTLYEGLEEYLTCPGVINTANLHSLKTTFEVDEYSNSTFTNLLFSVGNQMKNTLEPKFNVNTFVIYPFIWNISAMTNRVHIDVYFMLIQRFDYDLNYSDGRYIEISIIVDYFLSKVSSGDFHPKLSDGTQIKHYTECQELSCQNPGKMVEQPVSSAFSYKEKFSFAIVFWASHFLVSMC